MRIEARISEKQQQTIADSNDLTMMGSNSHPKMKTYI